MSAQTEAIAIIYGEHRALTVVIDALNHVADEVAAGKLTPDYKLLWSILYYIDEFPERLHHPKEEDVLFPLVHLRAPELDEALQELGRQHANSKAPLDYLKTMLGRMEADIPGASREFAEKAAEYANFHWKHMTLEEKVVLPKAKETFSEQDWEKVFESFSKNQDPLVNAGARGGDWFREFYRRIVSLVPEPWGLGARK